jgi:hypothetical protein
MYLCVYVCMYMYVYRLSTVYRIYYESLQTIPVQSERAIEREREWARSHRSRRRLHQTLRRYALPVTWKS